MPNYFSGFDLTFRALADPTRRAIVARLARGPASVSELALPFEMRLPSFMEHLQLLEASGLVRSEKVGRVRTCRLDMASISNAEQWLAAQRTLWESRIDRMEEYLEEIQGKGRDGNAERS